jgi:beta-lactamase superfamily II metal-dependent hydrolase
MKPTPTMTDSSNPHPTPHLTITFKNVGQGDTILLEWKRNNEQYIGIIDCKRNQQDENPVIEYLQSLGRFKLYFILLTHPHEDHCEGILELLQFIHDQQIEVFRFYHSFQVDARYLDKKAERAGMLMQRIRTMINLLEKKGAIRSGGWIGVGNILVTNEKFTISCLSPSLRELQKYQSKINYLEEKSLKDSRRAGNYLSTILKIETSHYISLLTADAEKLTFKRLINRHWEELSGKPLLLGQIPHHGSKDNYHENFWHKFSRQQTPLAAISVGDNSYKHPSLTVLESLHSAGYGIHCTNKVNDGAVFYDAISGTTNNDTPIYNQDLIYAMY